MGEDGAQGPQRTGVPEDSAHCPRPICREACAEVPQRFFVLSTASRVDSRKVSTRRVNLPWMKGGASKRYISGTGTSRSLPRTSKLSRVLSHSSSSLKRPSIVAFPGSGIAFPPNYPRLASILYCAPEL